MTSSKRRGPETPGLTSSPRSNSHPPVTSAVLRTPRTTKARERMPPPEIGRPSVRDETQQRTGKFQATYARGRREPLRQPRQLIPRRLLAPPDPTQDGAAAIRPR